MTEGHHILAIGVLKHRGNVCFHIYNISLCFQGLRGQDFNILFVDEANFIKPAAMHTIIGFLNQTKCKIIFVSSTNTGQTSTSLLYKLKETTNSFLNVVTYICDEHLPEVRKRTDIATCSCFVLHKPVYVSMDGEVRRTADLFVQDSFMHEIAGGRVGKNGLSGHLFTDSAIDQFLVYRPSTTNIHNLENINRILTVYIDPAYTSNRHASGTGIAIVTHLRDSIVILGMEHFYLESLTGESATEIARCAYLCISYVCLLHMNHFTEVRISVEGNSNQDSATAIAIRISKYMINARLDLGCDVVFAHTRQQGTTIAHPFYLLHKQKTHAFDNFISLFNSGKIMISQEVVSNTIRLGFDPCEYLVDQIRNVHVLIRDGDRGRTFSGKRSGISDDMLLAVVMAAFLIRDPHPSAGYFPIQRQ
ncbi:tripartite terminase subunit 3 [Psittacid alphaherpesvirus 5]|uniref:Tripartite terminase subunit 3 n=1 Tax=Psittacid alphaherpesvirus 5 TaxID=2972693 RepID=A0A5P9JTK5_9ALPH|nr:tripartite terminase subunit 3 [Psittacid alphaherpesvirus 5]QFU14585.1 tripartite terminase subunit 3 [Psittacid alphaherpesvirus 5]